MSKKYLLYIHAEEFETEPEKSALVNKLLSKHYGGAGGPDLRPGALYEEEVPEKNIAVPKGNPTGTAASKTYCKEHGVDKSVCALMKHKK